MPPWEDLPAELFVVVQQDHRKARDQGESANGPVPDRSAPHAAPKLFVERCRAGPASATSFALPSAT